MTTAQWVVGGILAVAAVAASVAWLRARQRMGRRAPEPSGPRVVPHATSRFPLLRYDIEGTGDSSAALDALEGAAPEWKYGGIRVSCKVYVRFDRWGHWRGEALYEVPGAAKDGTGG